MTSTSDSTSPHLISSEATSPSNGLKDRESWPETCAHDGLNRLPKLGTLQVGAPGDVAIMELVEGPVSFVDTRNNPRTGHAYLKPVQTVTAGVPFGRPYNSPFSVR
jgi:hypothetical protein